MKLGCDSAPVRKVEELRRKNTFLERVGTETSAPQIVVAIGISTVILSHDLRDSG